MEKFNLGDNMFILAFLECLSAIEKVAPYLREALNHSNSGKKAYDILDEIFNFKDKTMTEVNDEISKSSPSVLQEAEKKLLEWASNNIPNVTIEGKIKFDWN